MALLIMNASTAVLFSGMVREPSLSLRAMITILFTITVAGVAKLSFRLSNLALILWPPWLRSVEVPVQTNS